MPFCSITLTAQKPTKLPTVLNTIGDHIRKRRLELGLLQSRLAEHLGVRTDTIRNWERNRTAPTLRYYPKILEFLRYDPAPVEPKTLGEKLIRYRKLRGITQNELALQIGIDPTTLSKLERNQGKRFSQSVLKKVNDFLSGHR